MFKKLRILLILNILEVTKLLILNRPMHNLYAIFAKYLDICKKFAGDLVNSQGNIPRPGTVPRFSDLEIVALSLSIESIGLDSENYLFSKLREYSEYFPHLISRRQFNDRRKFVSDLCSTIRERIVNEIDAGENYFCVASNPIEVCHIARAKRCKIGKSHYDKAPAFGYCASQKTYYYGYKLHAICGLNGVIHSFDLTKANVHNIHYLQDIKHEYNNCTLLGDKGYLSAEVQLDLFETARIKLEVPYRLNQKDWKPTFVPFAKARRRIETVFSQMCDQFMITRNYANDTIGIFTRILSKISALTVLQYINKMNNKPIGRVKYALI